MVAVVKAATTRLETDETIAVLEGVHAHCTPGMGTALLLRAVEVRRAVAPGAKGVSTLGASPHANALRTAGTPAHDVGLDERIIRRSSVLTRRSADFSPSQLRACRHGRHQCRDATHGPLTLRCALSKDPARTGAVITATGGGGLGHRCIPLVGWLHTAHGTPYRGVFL